MLAFVPTCSSLSQSWVLWWYQIWSHLVYLPPPVSILIDRFICVCLVFLLTCTEVDKLYFKCNFNFLLILTSFLLAVVQKDSEEEKIDY